jgi:hypothetical protein
VLAPLTTVAIGEWDFIHVVAPILWIFLNGGMGPEGPEALPTYVALGPYTERARRALEGRLCLPDPLASVSPLCSQHDAGHRPNPQADESAGFCGLRL